MKHSHDIEFTVRFDLASVTFAGPFYLSDEAATRRAQELLGPAFLTIVRAPVVTRNYGETKW